MDLKRELEELAEIARFHGHSEQPRNTYLEFFTWSPQLKENGVYSAAKGFQVAFERYRIPDGYQAYAGICSISDLKIDSTGVITLLRSIDVVKRNIANVPVEMSKETFECLTKIKAVK